MIPPDGFGNWNRAMRGAYTKGHVAAESGMLLAACPYDDKRKSDGRLTWSRAFAAAWRDGWLAGDEARKQTAITEYYTDKQGHGQPPPQTR